MGESFDFVITVCDDADKNRPNFRGKVGRRVTSLSIRRRRPEAPKRSSAVFQKGPRRDQGSVHGVSQDRDPADAVILAQEGWE